MMRRFVPHAVSLLVTAVSLVPAVAWSQSGPDFGSDGAFAAPPVPIVDSSFNTHPVALPVTADDPLSLQRRLDATEQQLEMMRAELQSLRESPVMFDNNAAAPPAPAAADPNCPKEVPTITAPTAKLGGFFHLDSGAYSQDAASMATYGDMQDGVGFRRARMQATGNITEFTTYKLEMDFATAGRPSFMDVWVDQQKLPIFGNLRLGHFRQAFSMDSLNPVTQLEFLERSTPFQAFVPFRRVGLMAHDKSENGLWSWQYGAFRTGGFAGSPLGDDRFATDIGDNGGYSFNARGTHLLWYDEPAEGRYLLHVGGAYDYSRTTGSSLSPGVYEARSIPEFFVGDPAGGGLTALGTPFMVDTGRLAANGFNLFGVELAGQYGAFHFQGEYMATFVEQTAGPTVFYDGAYIQCGYFLTGENLGYDQNFGTFTGVKPFTEFFSLGRGLGIAGWGAWEITARYSYLNLNDPAAIPTVALATQPPVPNPGYLNESTVGLNWHWNANMKLQFNWIHADVNGALFGRSATDIYAGRCAVSF